jgi:hypothetical protein
MSQSLFWKCGDDRRLCPCLGIVHYLGCKFRFHRRGGETFTLNLATRVSPISSQFEGFASRLSRDGVVVQLQSGLPLSDRRITLACEYLGCWLQLRITVVCSRKAEMRLQPVRLEGSCKVRECVVWTEIKSILVISSSQVMYYTKFGYERQG